jgi:hypothetical protein
LLNGSVTLDKRVSAKEVGPPQQCHGSPFTEDHCRLMWEKIEVESGAVLELQAALLAIRISGHDDKRSHESNDAKVFAQLIGAPNLAVLGFECFTATRCGIDFCNTFTAN